MLICGSHRETDKFGFKIMNTFLIGIPAYGEFSWEMLKFLLWEVNPGWKIMYGDSPEIFLQITGVSCMERL